MANKIIYSILVSSILISCGDDKKTIENNTVEATEPIIVLDPLKVSLSAVVKKDDTIQIYYRFDPNVDFNSMHVVSTFVKGNPTVQTINFDIPTEKTPADFRFDFGTNSEQEPIEIKNFNLQYKGNAFNVRDTLFFQYFYPNEQIDYERATATAKTLKKDGVTYDPIFLPRPTLNLEVQKILGGQSSQIK